MKLYKAEAIVIRSRKYSEADCIITLYSRERGKIDAIAKGVRKLKSTKRGGVQLFTHGNFLLYEGRNLHTVTQCEAINSYGPLREELMKMSYATYIAELVDGFTVPEEGSDKVFALILASFTLLSALDEPELAVRVFEIRLMNLLGYNPQLDNCCNCYQPIKGSFKFSSSLGGLLCSNCFSHDPGALSCKMGSVKVLQQLATMDMRKLKVLKISPEIKREMERLMEEYLLLRVDKKLKTTGFIKKLKSFI